MCYFRRSTDFLSCTAAKKQINSKGEQNNDEKKNDGSSINDGDDNSDGSSDTSGSGEDSYTIGISQFAEHGSLDNCREGFLKGLENEGIVEGENLTVEYQNAAADMGTASQISDAFVSDKVDLICAIATPTAQSAYNAGSSRAGGRGWQSGGECDRNLR